ncbi:MAG: hypothetical protein SWH61_15500 [Thermodesulfobacteriota bacterium]|nr:hypothetical protein [Thermodesulfobacteriota bacterium]
MWQAKHKNAEHWDFERNHQIGGGDAFCDHTYIRKRYNTGLEQATDSPILADKAPSAPGHILGAVFSCMAFNIAIQM